MLIEYHAWCYFVKFDVFMFCWKHFSVPSHEIGWEERLRNDSFSVEWDVKPYSVQFITSHRTSHLIIGSIFTAGERKKMEEGERNGKSVPLRFWIQLCIIHGFQNMCLRSVKCFFPVLHTIGRLWCYTYLCYINVTDFVILASINFQQAHIFRLCCALWAHNWASYLFYVC